MHGKEIESAAFHERIQPALVEEGFKMHDYWIWGMSVLKGDEGLYHGFAARWSKEVPFGPNWVTNSEIVHATAEHPEGPYTFRSVVFERRGPDFFDGMMMHNPTIHKYGDTYLLFYTGSTYAFPYPNKEITQKMYAEARLNQRIGMATAKSLWGPWARSDEPILNPREGRWDTIMTTNPAVCVRPDGRILLVYKSSEQHRGGKLKLGAAEAKHLGQPFVRLRDEPIFQFEDSDKHVEDPYIWWNGQQYELLMKDMNGKICGVSGGGIHATSDNGIDWKISDPALAYRKTVAFDDGTTLKFVKFERVQVLVEAGKPTHLFFAVGINQKGKKGEDLSALVETWNLSLPLE